MHPPLRSTLLCAPPEPDRTYSRPIDADSGPENRKPLKLEFQVAVELIGGTRTAFQRYRNPSLRGSLWLPFSRFHTRPDFRARPEYHSRALIASGCLPMLTAAHPAQACAAARPESGAAGVARPRYVGTRSRNSGARSRCPGSAGQGSRRLRQLCRSP